MTSVAHTLLASYESRDAMACLRAWAFSNQQAHGFSAAEFAKAHARDGKLSNAQTPPKGSQLGLSPRAEDRTALPGLMNFVSRQKTSNERN